MSSTAAREGAGVSSVELTQVVLRSGETTTRSEEILRPARRAANRDVVCNRFRRRAAAAAAAVVVMACAAWTALAEPSDEPSSTAQQKSRAHNVTRNETFAVALLRQNCEHVPAGVVTSAFACPSTMIIAACLALVIAELYKVYEDAQAPSKNSVADEAKSDDGGDDGPHFDGNDAVEDREKCRVRSLQQQLAAMKQRAEQAEKKGCDDSAQRSRLTFAACHFLVCVVVLVFEAPETLLSIHGDSIPCYASRIMLLPLFKPLTVPMWGVLLTMLNYVYWEQARKYQPREVALGGKLRAGERPVERNWLLRCIVRGAAVLLAAWSSAALFAAPTLVGFLPVALMLLIGVPAALIIMPLGTISCVRSILESRGLKVKARPVHVMLAERGRLMQKVGLALNFGCAALMAYCMGLYYGAGHESWAELVARLWRSLPTLMLDLAFEMRFSFSWPFELPEFQQLTLAFAIGIGFVEYAGVLLRHLPLHDAPSSSSASLLDRFDAFIRAAMCELSLWTLKPFVKLARFCGSRSTRERMKAKGVTDDMVAEWAANNASEDTQELELNLTNCPNITDDALVSLQREFKKEQLRALELDAPGFEGSQLTGDAILSCVAHFDGLQLGSVLGKEKGDVHRMLETWLESDPFVERLDFSSGDQLPDDLVVRLATDLPSLRRGGLRVREWPMKSFGEVTDGVFVPFKKVYPGAMYRVAYDTADTGGITTLQFTKWPDPAGVGIASAIRACAATVNRVQAGQCELGCKGASALSAALKANSTLQELELMSNRIGAVGAQSLANTIQFNRALTSLNLHMNKIGAGGAKAIADALPQS